MAVPLSESCYNMQHVAHSFEANAPDVNLRREIAWFYPIEDIRETVVNALAHRVTGHALSK